MLMEQNIMNNESMNIIGGEKTRKAAVVFPCNIYN